MCEDEYYHDAGNCGEDRDLIEGVTLDADEEFLNESMSNLIKV